MNFDSEGLLAATEHLTGFVVVLLTLALLWGLTELMGWVFTRREEKARQRAPVAGAADASTAVGTEPLPEDLAVVAAAVAYLLDEPHQIVSVRPQPSSWGQQGRRDIHASHRIR